jgi:hypothetical protein
MYIRVKRQKTTVFLQVEPTDTVLEVKQKLQALLDKVRRYTRECCASLATQRHLDCKQQHCTCCCMWQETLVCRVPLCNTRLCQSRF